MIVSSHGIIGSSIVQFAFDADYQAVLDYATSQSYTLPSASQQILQNQLVLDLKAGGIWDDADWIRVAANDGGSQFATINWKNPNSYQAILVNSPSFLANNGFQSNGTSSYVNENWAPSDGVNFQLNDASEFIWMNTNLNGVAAAFLYGSGDSAGTNASILEKNSSTQIYPRINASSSGFLDNANNPTIGLYGVHRANSTACAYSKNGVVLSNFSTTSTSRTSQKSYTLARNNNGSVANFLNSGYYSFRLSGKNISGVKLTSLHTAISTYITSL
jgi:hypothetical protein